MRTIFACVLLLPLMAGCVDDGNEHPTGSSIELISKAGEQHSLDSNAADSDGDAVSFEVRGLPEGFSADFNADVGLIDLATASAIWPTAINASYRLHDQLSSSPWYALCIFPAAITAVDQTPLVVPLGDPVEFTFSLNRPAEDGSMVSISIDEAGASNFLMPAAIKIEEGATEFKVAVQAIDFDGNAAGRSAEVTLNLEDYLSFDFVTQIPVEEPLPPPSGPQLQWLQQLVQMSEGDSETVSITLREPLEADLVVDLAGAAIDFFDLPGQIIIPAGVTSADIFRSSRRFAGKRRPVV